MKRRRLCALAAAMLFALSCAAGLAEGARDITRDCKFRVSEGSAKDLVDDSWGSATAWTPRGNAELGVMLPQGAAHIQIDWLIPPTEYTFTECAEDQSTIATHSAEDDAFACISQVLPLNANSRYAYLRFSQKGQGVSRVRVFSEGELPYTAIEWEPPHEKCDLMVISTHQDDEWLWFGGIIPYYDLVQKKDVQVVYMANCGRYRYGEALNGLASSGVKTYPLFIGLKDKRDAGIAAATRTWNGKDNILKILTSVIRRFKPEVILTHDWNGEYGHAQHQLTSRAMQYAIEAAADPNQYPESAQEYGVWQVKKLYRHLETKGKIAFDWHVAYPEFGGRTGLQVATTAMNQHQTQLGSYHVEDHGQYDNALFGLSYSVVGDDAEHKDLFENIPTPTPEPTATPEPTPEPTPTPTVEPTPTPPPMPTEAPATPLPTPQPTEPAREAGGSAMLYALIGVAAVALCGAVGTMLYMREAARRRRRRRRKHKK